MKVKDYFRLSKISLKNRKKSTKSTVRGISFGLIMLMPLLFLIIAFYIDLNQKVDKDVAIRVFNISYTSEQSEVDYVEGMFEDYRDDINSLEGIESTFKYNYYYLANTSDYSDEIKFLTSVKIGDSSFKLDYHQNNRNPEAYFDDQIGITVIDANNESLFMNYDYAVLNGEEPLLYGEEFSENSNKEIMISSDFLLHYNLNPDDIVGNTLSISYEMKSTELVSSSLSTSNQEDFYMYYGMPIGIISDFKIVGVYNSKIYSSPARKATTKISSTMASEYADQYFWITSSSLYNASNEAYMPKYHFIEGEEYNQQFYYYDKDVVTLSREAKNNNCIFLPLGLGVVTNRYYEMSVAFSELVEFDSYDNANKASKIIDSYLEKSTTSTEDIGTSSKYQNETFTNYQMFYNVFTYICIVLAIFGGIIFIATLLNLYNTIHYSVQSRKNYIGMMRAIGIKRREVLSLYFVEVLQIFMRSYIWTAIFGGLICGGLTVLVDYVMSSDYAQLISIKLSFNPIHILVSFGIIVILNMCISILFSLVACHGVRRKPILDVLNENR